MTDNIWLTSFWHQRYTGLWQNAWVREAAPALLELIPLALTALEPDRNGHWPRWEPALKALAQWKAGAADFNRDAVSFALEGPGPEVIQETLLALHPWRKGPFVVGGVEVDTEWRSCWKWDRVVPHLAPLAGRRVLDIGCGNGYYGWRMLGEGADLVVGVDPFLAFVCQWAAFHVLCPESPLYVLPLGGEALPERLRCFDTVFSMGVLYHRKSPFEHLQQLREVLRPGGEVVLETLVVEGTDDQAVLVPRDRYAQMRNVWCLPSVPALQLWMERCGFREVRCVDVSVTTPEEQRTTEWMRFQSLADFLYPADASLTVEGYPAPRRAVMLAQA